MWRHYSIPRHFELLHWLGVLLTVLQTVWPQGPVSCHIGDDVTTWSNLMSIWRRCHHMIHFDVTLETVSPYGSKWRHSGDAVTTWFNLTSFWRRCHHMVQFDVILETMSPYGSTWRHFGDGVTTWFSLTSLCVSTWFNLTSCWRWCDHVALFHVTFSSR